MMDCSYEKFKHIFQSYITDDITQENHKQNEIKNNLKDLLDDDYDDLFVNNDVKTPWELELNNYITSLRAPKDTNVLQWWKSNTYLYPTIAKMARDYLCIPATSVPCERIFFEAGNVITVKRCSLSKERAIAQICINAWMKSKLKNQICNVRI